MGGRDLCRTPSMQQRPRPTSDLTEGAQAGFILLPDLAAAAGTRENIDQSRPRGLIKGVDTHPRARVGQRLLRGCTKPLRQRAKNRYLHSACILAQTQ